MEEKKLTHEEITLSILNGIVSSSPWMSLNSPLASNHAFNSAYELSVEYANQFIKLRDKSQANNM